MFSHVMVGANDLERNRAFYDAALAAAGLLRTQDHPEHGWYGYTKGGAPAPVFIVGKPINGRPATHANGGTIGFDAPTRAAVDAFHAAALAHGGTDEGAPGLRPHYHRNYYGAYVRDPDGNKLCCVCHRKEG